MIYSEAPSDLQIFVEPKNQTVGQGSNVEMRCDVRGILHPIIKWTRVGQQLDPSVDSTNQVLKLYNVQPSDRGLYVCVATNYQNLAQGVSTLEVERKF